MATTCGVIRWKGARPRCEACWPKLALGCASTNTSRATARPCSRTLVQAQGLELSLRALARLAKDEEPSGSGGEAGSGGGLELEHGRTSTISPSLVPHLQ